MRERPYKSLLPLPSSTIALSGSCVAFPYQEVVSPSLTIASPRWRVLRRERIFFQWRASIMRKRKKYIYFITKVPPVILRSPKNTNKLLSKCCIWVLLTMILFEYKSWEQVPNNQILTWAHYLLYSNT